MEIVVQPFHFFMVSPQGRLNQLFVHLSESVKVRRLHAHRSACSELSRDQGMRLKNVTDVPCDQRGDGEPPSRHKVKKTFCAECVKGLAYRGGRHVECLTYDFRPYRFAWGKLTSHDCLPKIRCHFFA